MKISDETLMAYADSELDPAERAEIEAAIASDPGVARAVARHRALAARVRGAYDDVLEEPVPDRLAALVATPRSRQVDDLEARRAARRGAAERRWLPQWAAIAASLAIGLFVGLLVEREPDAPYAEADGALVARGALDAALTTQLASAPGDSGVQLGISFRGSDGAYCRSFHLQHAASLAGLACRSGDAWKLEVLAAAPAATGESELRPAAAMPLAVLKAVDARIDGDPLDAAAEAAARDAGWQEAPAVAE